MIFSLLFPGTDRTIEEYNQVAYDALHIQTNIFCRLLMMVMPYLSTTGAFFL